MKGTRKSFIFLIMIVALSMLFIPIVYGDDKPDEIPVYVNSYIPFVDNDLDEEWGDRVIWSNYTKLFYIFTHFDHDIVQHSATHEIIGYAFSPDGVNWVLEDDFFEQEISVHAEALRGEFDFTMTPDNRYIWFAWIDIDSRNVLIIKCELNMDGTITPLTSTQTVVTSIDGWINIEVDSNGRPFVSYNRGTYPNFFADVRWSDETNGTWVQDGQETFDNLFTPNIWDGYPEHTKLHRLAEGKMAWTMTTKVSIGFHGFTAWTAVFDGTNWLTNAKVIFADGAATGDGFTRLDIVSYGDELIAVYDFDTFRHYLYYRKKTYSGAWSGAIQLTVNDDIRRHPALSVDPDGNVYLFLMINGGDSINYTVRYSNGTWSGNWINYYDNNSQVFNWNEFSCPDNFNNYCPIVYHDDSYSDMELLFDYLAWDEDYLPVIMTHYNTTLYDSDGSINDGWIFRGETYTLESYFKGATTFALNFTDGEHDIEFTYNNATQRLSIVTDDQFVIGDYYFNITEYSGGIVRAKWGFIPNTNIVDINNATIDYSMYNEEYDLTLTGDTGIEFNIYNLGGYTYYTFVGDGGRTVGGSPFELYATNGTENSYAKAEQIFRKLQHISFLMELDMDNEWESGDGEFDFDLGIGYVDVGFDYRLNGSWVEGFKVKLYPYSADVGHHDLGIDHDWVEWSVDFYNYNPSTGDQQNVATQYIYSNHWGYEHENYVPDYYNRTSSQLWIDLWFDRTNASTTIACQVNAYYHGIKEQGSSWWFGYGKFVPMISDYDNAKFLDDLYDEGGNITNCQKYDLIKFFIKVGKVADADGDDETWIIRAIEDMHREQAIDRMEGIDEPTFVETKVLDMPQTGFINAIKSAIGGIAKSITDGIFFAMKSLWAGVGWVAELMGLKAWYDALSIMLGNIATASLNFMDSLELSLINSALLLEQIIRLVSTGLTRYTFLVTAFITSILSWYGHIVDMFTGGGIWSINIWMSLSLGDWFELGLTLLPVWWVIRLSKADDIIRTLQGDLTFVISLITGVYWFLTTIIFLTVELLTFLIGLLPI